MKLFAKFCLTSDINEKNQLIIKKTILSGADL